MLPPPPRTRAWTTLAHTRSVTRPFTTPPYHFVIGLGLRTYKESTCVAFSSPHADRVPTSLYQNIAIFPLPSLDWVIAHQLAAFVRFAYLGLCPVLQGLLNKGGGCTNPKSSRGQSPGGIEHILDVGANHVSAFTSLRGLNPLRARDTLEPSWTVPCGIVQYIVQYRVQYLVVGANCGQSPARGFIMLGHTYTYNCVRFAFTSNPCCTKPFPIVPLCFPPGKRTASDD
eukprot:4297094-Pyramimonas_sp.AAC.1